MISAAIGKASSMEDIGSRKPRRDTGFAGDRMPPATGYGYRDSEIDTGAQSGQTLDSARSRGYGRYEI
jgi:hypothetical protein